MHSRGRVPLSSVPAMRTEVLGRDRERAALDAVLDGSEPQSLVLAGEAGIGKSALWEHAVAKAAARGWQVLESRVAATDTGFGFGTLTDLLAGTDLAEPPLTEPVRRALAAAVLRDVPRAAVGAHAVAVGATDVLAWLAARAPVLVAIDDVQWTDPESMRVLSHAARRLVSHPVGFLLTRRAGTATTEIEIILRQPGLDVLEVGPLAREEIARLLAQRLDLDLPRWVLVKVADHSRGNPLFALELGRVLRSRGLPPFGAPLAVSGELEGLLAERVDALPRAHRELLVTTAAEPHLTELEARRFLDAADLATAVESRVVTVDPADGRIRPAHPLIAAAAWTAASPAARRTAHLRLADALDDRARSTRHRALATDGCDEQLAAALDEATRHAVARGATESAVELARLGLDRSEPGDRRLQRVITLGERLSAVGATSELTTYLQAELPSFPAGPLRAQGWLLAIEGDVETVSQALSFVDRAIDEAHEDDRVRAAALSIRARVAAIIEVRDVAGAVRDGDEALALDRDAWEGARWSRAVAGLPDAGLVDHPAAAVVHAWRGDVHRARSLLEAGLQVSEQGGDHADYLQRLLHLVEVELRAGRLDRAEELLDLQQAGGYDDVYESPDVERCRARLAALRGDVDQARRWLDEARPAAAGTETGWALLDLLVTEGLAATCAGEHGLAATAFGEVWEWCRREGADNPGAFPVAGHLVAALLQGGRTTAALEVVGRLERLAVEQDHPWAAATVRRCRSLLAFHEETVDAAEVATTTVEVAAELERLGLFLDAATALAAAGAAVRRRRQWGLAKELLSRAVEAYDACGATGWADAAREELSRVGGRRRTAPGTLTPAELRAAQLAADGLSNQQIARRTGTSVRTVEAHLGHVYTKLGVASRTQLPTALRAIAAD
jgi:DNA-binding CsgD family transcriptional regulator